VIINPLKAVSGFLWRFIDSAGIDGFVNGLGRFFMGIGKALRPIQTGRVQSYLFAMFLGLLALLAAYVILNL
jgi:NADH:ubiquinone oxidoreductase subunit 5 (subunit L)/multisubunit Na+/H+ antiporter MnhA subunit